jgi:hypothetical protein
MNVTLTQQIMWIKGQLKFMQQDHPLRIADGILTPEAAEFQVNCAVSIMRTLGQLRGLAIGEVSQ